MITLLIMGKHTRFCSYKVKLLKPAHHLKFKKCQPPKKEESHSPIHLKTMLVPMCI